MSKALKSSYGKSFWYCIFRKHMMLLLWHKQKKNPLLSSEGSFHYEWKAGIARKITPVCNPDNRKKFSASFFYTASPHSEDCSTCGSIQLYNACIFPFLRFSAAHSHQRISVPYSWLCAHENSWSQQWRASMHVHHIAFLHTADFHRCFSPDVPEEALCL